MTSKEQFLQLVTQGRMAYQPDSFGVREVTVVTNNVKYNTTAVVFSLLRGESAVQKTIRYTRKPFTTYFATDRLSVPLGEYHNTIDLVQVINRIYGKHLVNSDIVPERIVGTVSNSIWLSASPNCPMWIGGIYVDIGLVVEDSEDLESGEPVRVTKAAKNKKPLGTTYYNNTLISSLSNRLPNMVVGESIDARFVTVLNVGVSEEWHWSSVLKDFNLRGAIVTYNGPTKGVGGMPIPLNPKLSRAVVVAINEPLCNNLSGCIAFYY